MAKKIAIVEDDPDQRSNYLDAITKKGYDVVAYSSRQEALDGFDKELPDLAILDIILGDEVDGLLVDRLELVGHVGVAQRSFSHGRSPLKFRR